MTVRNFQYLLRPRSLVVIGASDREGSVGAAVTRNVLDAQFRGDIAFVSPAHPTVYGRTTFPNVDALPFAPDLAVLCTSAASIPGAIGALGRRGTHAAIVLASDLNAQDISGHSYGQLALDASKPYLLRILGPNCVGVLVPSIGLNASFAHAAAQGGSLAFVSQSGALTTALLDWAQERNIGFSHFISLGDAADVDFGDLLDYLATDPATTAILLYIESIKAARKFMSAARAAGRTKRIIAIKAGRAPEGAKAAASHTGALAGADDVYHAALRRAGALRVDSTLDLFLAAETLSRAKALKGERLAILTNGGGPGVLAADALSLCGGRLASFAPETLDRLDAVLPRSWSHGDPADIVGDAPASRYVDAIGLVLEDPAVDALLFLHAPTAIVDSDGIAQAVVPLLAASSKPSFTCWLGGAAVARARAQCTKAGLPTYETPEDGVRAFMQVVEHRRNQQMLMETPSSLPYGVARDPVAVRAIVTDALRDGRELLTYTESKRVLEACGIVVAKTRAARDPSETVAVADELGYPVAVKILSPDISHKSDVGGVALDLHSATAVADAATSMLQRVAAMRPDARLQGFAVEVMVPTKNAFELIVGISTDPVFGPVILFGAGGTAVEIVRDKAVALPPLNTVLARDLIDRTRVSKLLAGYRDVPAANVGEIERVLIAVAQLAADIPEIVELDINPLLACADKVTALDARIRVTRPLPLGASRFAIRPYPVELEERVDIRGRECLIRPIRPEDETAYPLFIEKTRAQDFYFRFFHALGKPSHESLARYTQIDYDREMALVAFDGSEMVGVVRAVSDPDNVQAEFAIIVRSDWAGRGLAHALMSCIIRYCKGRGIQELLGEVLSENARMLALARSLDFRVERLDPQTVRIVLRLNEARATDKESASLAAS